MSEDNAMVARPKEWVSTTRDFFRDTSSEMKKVTWPSRQEIVGTTLVVIVAVLIFGVYLWGCDVLFYNAIDFLFHQFGTGL